MDGGGSDKIKLFKFIQKTNQNIGLYPPESNQIGISFNLKNRFSILSHAQFIISSAAYLLLEANSMIEYGTVFFLCTTILFYMTIYMIYIWQIRNISSFIENCEQFVEKRTHSGILYKETNKKIEQLTEYFAYAFSVSGIMLVLPFALYTVVSYCFLDSGKESFVLFCPVWWPLDWKAPFGYLTAWLAQCAAVGVASASAISFYNFVFGSGWFFIVMGEDITNDVIIFNSTIQTVGDDERTAELKDRFCDVVQHYLDAKQCVNDFNKICEYSFFAFFLWNMVSVSSLLVTLQFQLWNDDSELLQIMILLMTASWIFLINLAICEPGQRVTDHFEQFGVEFGRCEWNKLSIKMQQMYLIFLSDTQQPKNIRSYGRIICTRDTFKQIITKGFSYFMTFRRFRT